MFGATMRFSIRKHIFLEIIIGIYVCQSTEC